MDKEAVVKMKRRVTQAVKGNWSERLEDEKSAEQGVCQKKTKKCRVCGKRKKEREREEKAQIYVYPSEQQFPNRQA